MVDFPDGASRNQTSRTPSPAALRTVLISTWYPVTPRGAKDTANHSAPTVNDYTRMTRPLLEFPGLCTCSAGLTGFHVADQPKSVCAICHCQNRRYCCSTAG